MKKYKFSLIIGTLNREKHLKKCLDSILNQTYKNFEVIIVDQNEDENTYEMIKNSSFDFDLQYIHINKKGLSHARNVALKHTSGTHICLIDDDAVYSPNYLVNLNRVLNKNPKAIINGKIWNPKSQKNFVSYSGMHNGCKLTLRQIIRYCPSPSITIPKIVFRDVGTFDEYFGVGAKFGAGEETDLILRAYLKNYRVYYFDQIKLEHPSVVKGEDQKEEINFQKLFNYSVGFGALYTKYIKYQHMFGLLPVYIERQSKLKIKRIIGNREQRKASKYQMRGTRLGVKEYISMMKKA